MGAKQAKTPDEAGASPQSARCRRTPTRERSNDVRASLVLRAGEKLARTGPPPPYQRRVGMIQDMMHMAKQGKHDEATEMLKTLRQVREWRSSVFIIRIKSYVTFHNHSRALNTLEYTGLLDTSA